VVVFASAPTSAEATDPGSSQICVAFFDVHDTVTVLESTALWHVGAVLMVTPVTCASPVGAVVVVAPETVVAVPPPPDVPPPPVAPPPDVPPPAETVVAEPLVEVVVVAPRWPLTVDVVVELMPVFTAACFTPALHPASAETARAAARTVVGTGRRIVPPR
ncbi:MAG TPA: hypothetical protein VID05_06520, partial [Acidimicrobiales bacterium]